ncbi:MAG: aminoglycoside phosphotransferase family protein [Lysobacterales bacterium]|nr:MAG: aminoglycoside phosphotransferase family protein [Xanthomonadales bacterium]
MDDLALALERMGLLDAGQRPALTALPGGVSSDIWRVDLPSGPACIKRALSRLRVDAEWYAPVERNRHELEWMRCAARIVPEAVPEILGADDALGMFVMRYLSPADYPLWKQQLSEAVADTATAACVGERLVRIHSATAGDGLVASRFATDETFFAIRLEPYLLATARAHPELAGALESLAETTAGEKRALVHGDVSPKNLLIGPQGPVFLDAECAWYGDPAFDLAFCLNHLLLKCLWVPPASDAFLACFQALTHAHLAGVDWEEPRRFEARAARLLPGLLLARVDGKSPVEYLTGDSDKNKVRRVAARLLKRPAARLAEVVSVWSSEIQS